MKIYYLDEPLNEEELTFVKEAISEREGLRAIQAIEKHRIPALLPSRDKKALSDKTTKERINNYFYAKTK